MKKARLSKAAFALLLIVGVARGLSAADFSPWSHRMALTFSGYPADRGALTNFPALVVLRDGNNGVDFADFEPDAADLRFADDTESKELNYEIEAWDDASSNAWIWVQVPTLTNSAVIYAYWGRAGATTPAYTTNGAVWSNAYRSVWHLAQDPSGTSPQIQDSSSNKLHGATSGSMTSGDLVSAKIGQGLDFDGTDDRVSRSLGALNAPFTVHTWARFEYLNQPVDNYDYVMMLGTPNNSMSISRSASPADTYYSYAHGAGLFGPALVGQQWLHLVAVYDSISPYHKLYINGQPQTVDDLSSALSTDGTLYLAEYKITPNHWFYGRLDEVRISTTARSADWIWASWATVESNATFAVHGAAAPVTQTAPAIETRAPSSILALSADLNGYLVSTGASDTAAYVLWDRSDGGTNRGLWANTNIFPATLDVGSLSTNVTLWENSEYFYRFAASNEAGFVWAADTAYLLSAPVTVRVDPPTLGERGETATFTFMRPAAVTSMPVVVNYTNNGTATMGEDYEAPAALQVTIPAGATSATVEVTTIMDAETDGDETLTLELRSGAYFIGSPSNATVTITNTAPAATNSTVADGDWSDPGIWSDLMVPVEGQSVSLGHGVALTNSTPRFSSFTMTNGTLTFMNWATCLRADTVDIQSGTLSPADPFFETAMSNRVWIACTDFTLAESAAIQANYLGFSGGNSSVTKGQGPGGTAGTVSPSKVASGGAGHGGAGGQSDDGRAGGSVYGNAFIPEAPGSGSGNTRYSSGRHGGGAVFIDATGTVTLDSSITADGQIGTSASFGTGAGGGSGGSIMICGNVVNGGADALLSAAGGNGVQSSKGGGGGGRIAVWLRSTYAQRTNVMANPETAEYTVTNTHPNFVGDLSVDGGYGVDADTEGKDGSLAFYSLPATNSDVAAVAGNITNISYGALAPAVFTAAAFDAGSSSSLGIDTYSISCPQDETPGEDVVTLTSAGIYAATLTVVDLGGFTNTDNGTLTVVRVENQTTSWTGGGDDNLWSTHANWDNYMPGPDSLVTVGVGATVVVTEETHAMTSFTMTGGTLTFSNWTTRLQADTVDIQAGTISPAGPFWESGPTWDAAMSNRVWIVCGDLTLAESAAIQANYRGFCGGLYGGESSGYGQGPGGTWGAYSSDATGGAGHGGAGGKSHDNRVGGVTYGSPYLPMAPGSGSGRTRYTIPGRHGGGAVLIDATGTVTLNGSITANGQIGTSSSFESGAGGGSGGSIMICGNKVYGGANALLSAAGGNGVQSGKGGGGGGRIAVWLGLTAFQRAQVAADLIDYTMATNHVHYQGSISVDGGTGADELSEGEDGTFAVYSPPPSGMLITVR